MLTNNESKPQDSLLSAIFHASRVIKAYKRLILQQKSPRQLPIGKQKKKTKKTKKKNLTLKIRTSHTIIGQPKKKTKKQKNKTKTKTEKKLIFLPSLVRIIKQINKKKKEKKDNNKQKIAVNEKLFER